MRGTLILLTLVILISGIYNTINLAESGSRGLLLWGLVFAAGIPVIAIGQAWYVAHGEDGPLWSRPSVLILFGVLLVQAAIMPLGERLREIEDPRR